MMDEATKAAVDERVEWIQAVVADATKRGGVAIREAINDLDPEHLPGILFMLLSTRVHDEQRLRELIRAKVESDTDYRDTA